MKRHRQLVFVPWCEIPSFTPIKTLGNIVFLYVASHNISKCLFIQPLENSRDINDSWPRVDQEASSYGAVDQSVSEVILLIPGISCQNCSSPLVWSQVTNNFYCHSYRGHSEFVWWSHVKTVVWLIEIGSTGHTSSSRYKDNVVLGWRLGRVVCVWCKFILKWLCVNYLQYMYVHWPNVQWLTCGTFMSTGEMCSNVFLKMIQKLSLNPEINFSKPLTEFW